MPTRPVPGRFLGVTLFLLATLLFALRDAASKVLLVQLLWAMLLGVALFGHWPDLATCIGMLIIGAASLSQALHRPRAPS